MLLKFSASKKQFLWSQSQVNDRLVNYSNFLIHCPLTLRVLGLMDRKIYETRIHGLSSWFKIPVKRYLYYAFRSVKCKKIYKW